MTDLKTYEWIETFVVTNRCWCRADCLEKAKLSREAGDYDEELIDQDYQGDTEIEQVPDGD